MAALSPFGGAGLGDKPGPTSPPPSPHDRPEGQRCCRSVRQQRTGQSSIASSPSVRAISGEPGLDFGSCREADNRQRSRHFLQERIGMRASVGLFLLLATSSCAHQRAARFDVATCPPPDSLNTDTPQGSGRDVPRGRAVPTLRPLRRRFGVLPGSQFGKIQASIRAISSLGGVCVQLANILTGALTRVPSDIHMYSHSAGYSFGGYASGSGPKSLIGLDDYWTNVAIDSQHLSADGRDLQEVLAHEADHILQQSADHADPGGYTTTHSEQCRGY